MQEKVDFIKDENLDESVDTTIVESQEEIKEEKELTLQEKIQQLQSTRMGNFKVTLSLTDAKYLRNMLDKTEYKGPQQAYLLIISKLEMTNICEQLGDKDKESRHSVEMSSAAVESLTFFMNQKTGKGIDSAQRLFSASMQLRPAITEINQIDEAIASMQQELEVK